jgi:hypothetical protein
MTLILIAVAAAETLPWNRAIEGDYQTFVADHSLIAGGTLEMAFLINAYGQSINTECHGLRCVRLGKHHYRRLNGVVEFEATGASGGR